MEITWYGHSCFRLVERQRATVITDPFDDSLGYAIPKIKGEIVTISHDAPGHNNQGAVKGEPRVIIGPGEYEIGGVFVIGTAMNNVTVDPPKANIAFLFDFEGLTVAHLGDLDRVPQQSEIEALGEVNVALVPIGGGGALNSTQAAEVIALLEPNIVIPMHFKTEFTTLPLDPLDKFLKEMGVSHIQQEDTLKLSASGLPETTQIVVLNCVH
jgi:L-ascorbate metabolism protein UlaG (beta-lactamase superfamily)